MEIDSYSYSSVGGRDENQDALGKAVNGATGLFVVADGLGGHQFGRRAADGAVNSLLRSWDGAALPTEEMLMARIRKANEEILSIQERDRCTTKSTVVALYIKEQAAVWANTGDSRLYFIRKDHFESITEDHSVAYLKYRSGEITREEIATDEDQSSLLRALGNRERWEPSLDGAEELRSGDGFLLCSDGFWEHVQDGEILVDFLKSGNAREWAERMLLRLVERSQPGDDNLSLITVML